jgi:hypothetical protein
MGYDLQKIKAAIGVAPISVNGTAATCTAVDTKNAGSVMWVFLCGTAAADLDAGVKVQECETSGGSYTDITGATCTTVVAATVAGTISTIFVETRGRKRYQKLVIDPGVGATLVGAVALLSDMNTAPASATAAGVLEKIVVG